MAFAVEMYFSPEMEKTLRDLRSVLSQNGIRPVLNELGDTPHISLAVFSDLEPGVFEPDLRRFAAGQSAFPVRLNGVGSFPEVLFLRPEPTQRLIKIHRDFHNLLATLGMTPIAYYRSDQWIPHCTMAQDVAAELMPRALEIGRQKFPPVDGMIERIGLVQFRPVVRLCTFPLAKASR
jgi:2'-5' RNA ligase